MIGVGDITLQCHSFRHIFAELGDFQRVSIATMVIAWAVNVHEL